MYKNILIATDGSDLSKEAVAHGLALAKAVVARVTIVTAHSPLYSQMSLVEKDLPAIERHELGQARARLETIVDTATVMKLVCDPVLVTGKFPYEGIVETANAKGCDLIVMASHGWRGISAVLLGSEAQKVLTHSKIPVLIHRR